MAVNYPIAPWLKPADTVDSYAKGFSLGTQSGHAQAQIAMERARLAQHANQQAVEITLKQQQVERQNMVEQQKLEVAKAYHQEQTQLKAQELQQKQEMLQQKIQEAAARQMVMDRYRQGISNGEDPVKLALGLAGMSGTGAFTSKALGLMDERMNPQLHEPQIKELPDGTTIAWNPGNKNFAITHIPSDKGKQIPLKDLYAQTLKTEQEMSMHIDPVTGKKDPMYSTLEKTFNELQGMIADRQSSGAKGSTNAAPKILTLPSDVKDAVDGGLYYTPKGVLKYDKAKGKFLPPSPQASVEASSDMEVADTDISTPESDDTESEDA